MAGKGGFGGEDLLFPKGKQGEGVPKFDHAVGLVAPEAFPALLWESQAKATPPMGPRCHSPQSAHALRLPLHPPSIPSLEEKAGLDKKALGLEGEKRRRGNAVGDHEVSTGSGPVVGEESSGEAGDPVDAVPAELGGGSNKGEGVKKGGEDLPLKSDEKAGIVPS